MVKRLRKHSEQLVEIDKPDFRIEGNIFAQMPGRYTRFRPVNWPHLKNPLKDSYHHLLIKLWRLRQGRYFAKIIGLKDLGPAFRRSSQQLGRVDLGKSLVLK